MGAQPSRRIEPDADRVPLIEAARISPGRLRHLVSRSSAVIGLCLGLIGVVGLWIQLGRGQAQVQELRRQVNAQRESVRWGQVELARLAAPERILLESTERLGMVRPDVVVPLVSAPGSATSSSRDG
ncbi:MAG: hypothetical protein ACT4OS_06110 [Acidimicrobiales bacterium]